MRPGARLDDFAGAPLDTSKLERNIADIYALDAFESVTYDLRQEDGPAALEIKSTAKRWGPNYVRFGINLEGDFQGGSNYNIATRLTMTELNPLGGEFHTELQTGESPRLFAELFQPLDYRSPWFINPKLDLDIANYRVSVHAH